MRHAAVSLARADGGPNEDSTRVDAARGIFVLADGMGGAASGEAASACAADGIMERLAAWADSGAADPRTALAEAARAAGERIRGFVREHPESRGMGSTAVACLVRGGRLFSMNVGDSRAYVLRGDSLILMSEDHSLVAEMARAGAIDGRELRGHRLRHVLSRALGMEGDPEPAIRETVLREGDLVILCSDGVSEALDDEAILGAAGAVGRDPARLALALATAGRAGDDSSAIVVEPLS